MQRLDVVKLDKSFDYLIKKPVPKQKNVINDDVIVYENDKPILLQKTLPDDFLDVLWSCKNLQYSKHKRESGLSTTSTLIGYRPRAGTRNNYCSIVATARKNPKQHNIVIQSIYKLLPYYQEYFSEDYINHKTKTDTEILPIWRIKETPFTSGIINWNNVLSYHYDSGNFRNVKSLMLVLKNGCTGGELHLPQYDITLGCPDSSLLIFDGQSILHGVTPFHLNNSSSYRYSIVFYSLEQMNKCLTPIEEANRANAVKTLKYIKK